MRQILRHLREDATWWISLTLAIGLGVALIVLMNRDAALLRAGINGYFTDAGTAVLGEEAVPANPADAEVHPGSGTDAETDAEAEPDAEKDAGAKGLTIVELYLSDLPEAQRKTVSQGTVMVTVGKGLAFDNGTIIRPGLILTAAHAVAAQKYELMFVICGSRKVEATLKAMSLTDDLALLDAPDCDGEPVALAPKLPKVNDELLICGYLIDSTWTTLERFCHGTSIVPRGRPKLIKGRDDEMFAEMAFMGWKKLPGTLAMAGTLPRGSSGSVVLDRRGRIVGMLSAVDPQHGRMQIVPAKTIRRFLKKSEIK